jgi:ketosteroid isomerase-like protein
MSVTLPEVVTRYFAAASARDTDTLLACFAVDGSVTDEGRMMTGHQAIRAWREGANSQYSYTTEVIGAGPLDRSTDKMGTEVVIARLEGDFPGSPVDLTFRFVVRDDLIAALEIAP